MSGSLVTVAREGSVAVVTLVQPSTSNRLDAPLRDAVARVCADLESNATVWVAVFAGEGGAFATGMEPLPAEGSLAVGPASVVAAMAKPTVAWIDGDCLDMGLELALACDVRVAAPGARLGMRQVGAGMLPWDGGTQRLARAVGRAQALRLLLTGAVLSADEALRIGLVQQVGTWAEARSLAEAISSGAPIAGQYAKEAVLAGLDGTLDQGLRLEADLSVLLQSTDDRRAGLRSFGTDRSPEYRGS